MASSRKRRNASVGAAVRRAIEGLRSKRFLVGLSGGVDSVVLLHALAAEKLDLRAAHVHHGLSPHADQWVRFCERLCKELGVPLTVHRVRVARKNEASARAARYAALKKHTCDVLALAHQLDDQAETVLLNLLRGAGKRGASGMPARGTLDGRLLVRPLLDVPREAIVAYAHQNGLKWIEDESNASDAFSRNFLRLRIAPLLTARYPRWREALARAARHFARRDADARDVVREFLSAQGLRAPSEAKLAEMLKQLTSGAPGTLIEHDGARLRTYRGAVIVEKPPTKEEFQPVEWRGERRIAVPGLGGVLRFSRARGAGIDPKWLKAGSLHVRLRSGGERLQPDPRRPRRTLKNLFQEAGVPSWQRKKLPLIYRGDDLVWAPGLGVDVCYRAAEKTSGFVPEWRVTC